MKLFFSAAMMQLKRLLKQYAVLACFLCIPLITLGLGLMARSGEDPARMNIGVYLPPSDPMSERVYESLLHFSDGELMIARMESETELMDKVAAGILDLGYVFPENMEERLLNGRYSRMITRVASPASPELITAWPITYVITSAVLENFAPQLAVSYLEEKGITSPEDRPEVFLMAEDTIDMGQLMDVAVVSVRDDTLQPEMSSTVLTGASLVRGLIALMLLVFAYIMAVRFRSDMQSGFFARISPYMRPSALFFASFLAAALLCVVTGVVSLIFAHGAFPHAFSGIVKEAGLLLVYAAYLSCFAFAICSLFSYAKLVGAMPFVLIACLVFCPIVIDVSGFVPVVGVVSFLLPPTLYLRAAAGQAHALFEMALMMAAYLLIGMGASKFQKSDKSLF
ncbi:ABC transporter permease [Christensenellaceae bacterium OttesenSCG-928-M15]|nr:ABC transporter permease [Christensenellaceae bacterium OttesenSCG-928-M15]